MQYISNSIFKVIQNPSKAGTTPKRYRKSLPNMSRLVVCIVIIFSLSGCSSKLGNSIVRPFIVSMPDNDDVELLRSIKITPRI